MAPDQANHAIRDGDFPLVYIAGEHGLYKYFADSGVVALMKSIDYEAGERGLMVGYAALSKKPAIAGILELVVMPTTTGYDKIAHFVPGDGWIAKTPPAPNRPWTDINISKLDANKWVAYTNQLRPWGSQDIFVSNTNGVSWTRLLLNEHRDNVELAFAGWSPHADNFLWVAGRASSNSSVDGYADVWYGDPFAGELARIQIIAPTRHSRFYGVAIMENGDILLRGRTGGSISSTYPVYTVTPAGVVSSLGGANISMQTGHQVIGLIGTDNILGVFGKVHELYKAVDYHAVNLDDTGLALDATSDFNVPASGSRGYLEVLQGMRYFVGRPNVPTTGIREITNPFASPSVLPSYGAGYPVGSVRADMQSRTALAAMSKRAGQGLGGSLFYVFSEGAWAEMAGPDDALPADLSDTALEPIVRPE